MRHLKSQWDIFCTTFISGLECSWFVAVHTPSFYGEKLLEITELRFLLFAVTLLVWETNLLGDMNGICFVATRPYCFGGKKLASNQIGTLVCFSALFCEDVMRLALKSGILLFAAQKRKPKKQKKET